MRIKYLAVLGVLCLTVPPVASARADYGWPGDAIEMADVESGALLTAVGGARPYIPLPGLRTDVDIEITGVAAHVQITQAFHNPSTRWLEAVYVFPLPEDSAVTRLRMKVGNRVIEGVVREKSEARRQYAKARQQGSKAGLVEQQRPNLFTSRVANIPPGEAIEITLSYFQTVTRTGDTYHLRVPLVVAPRYRTPRPAERDNDGDTAPVGLNDPARLRGPNTIAPRFGKVNPVSLSFELDAGFELHSVASPYHHVKISRPDASRASGRLADGEFADRDFELRWQPAAGTAPQAAVFLDKSGSGTHVMLMLQPPLPDRGAPPGPRELILIIDASGSMHGDSIEQALAAARFALSTLDDHDRFNIVRFSDSAAMLFPSPQPAAPAALAQAEQFLGRVEAKGGTNMAAALHTAFSNPVTRQLLRQVVFLTDGAVSNEAALFKLIADNTRAARLFTVGIGSAPNGYFMRRAARAGRGTHTYIGQSGDVAAKMTALFQRLRRPALTGIEIDWRGMRRADDDRPPMPDLYYGEPLTRTARLSDFRGVTVRGRYAGALWEHEVEPAATSSAPWVSTLWARRRIEQLEDELLGGGDREAVKRRITRLGLDHQLVTPYTSLVAVERRLSRDPTDPLHRSDAPVNLPHGWSYRHVFGSLPQTALGWGIELVLGACLLLGGGLLWRCARARRCSPAPS